MTGTAPDPARREEALLLARIAATDEVLAAIAAQPADPRPAFGLIARHVQALAGATTVSILEYDGTLLHRTADVGYRPDVLAALQAAFPRPAGPDFVPGRTVLAGEVVHVADLASEPGVIAPARQMGARSYLGIPLRHDGRIVGVLGLGRADVGAFDAAAVQLALSFAQQTVIAIANTRLIAEQRDALARQAATAELLQVINASPGNLAPVFRTILDKAHALCGAAVGALFLLEDGLFRAVTTKGYPPEIEAVLRRPRPPGGRTQVLLDGGRFNQTVDIRDGALPGGLDEVVAAFGVRTSLLVPLREDGRMVGWITANRLEVKPYTEPEIALLESFAAQAVIAMRNTRLVDELRTARDRAEAMLADLRRTQDRLVQTEKLASLGQLTAGIAHEIKNPLNFVNNFADLSAELLEELRAAAARVPLDPALRAEFDDLTATLKDNLDRILQHGRRADSIVRNMLMHSRTGEAEAREVMLNELATEALTLAYHGARAARADFNVTLEQDLDPEAGAVEVFPQEITRVLLNLCGNGFHAAQTRSATAGTGFAPTLRLTTRNLGDRVEVRVRDNGTGMPDAVRARIFEPFFTTKPAGEGTGLGLSLSHDIIVKRHGGEIAVDSRVDAFTEFVVTLPRTLAAGGTRAA